MTNTEPTTCGAIGTSVAAYEELRKHVLTASTGGSHSGLVVLLRQGFAAWMARRSAAPPLIPLAADTPPCRAALLPSDEIRTGVVRILASIALAGRRERSV